MSDPCREAYERAFTGSNRTAASWAAFKAIWKPPFVITNEMVDAGAKALAGEMADEHNARWGRRWSRAVLEAALASGMSGLDPIRSSDGEELEPVSKPQDPYGY